MLVDVLCLWKYNINGSEALSVSYSHMSKHFLKKDSKGSRGFINANNTDSSMWTSCY